MIQKQSVGVATAITLGVVQAAHAGAVSVNTFLYFNSSTGTPNSGLVADAAGNLYGTTEYGGGYGTVFELSGANHQTFTTVCSFNNGTGEYPMGGLTVDAAGNLYGTTYLGGTSNDGTAFELSGPGHQALTTLVNFNFNNGDAPVSGLTFDSAGNLYGTTIGGGVNGYGTVFELSGSGHTTLTTIHAFNNADGDSPRANLLIDAAGNIYGTTRFGGSNIYYGTVFELSGPNHGTFNTLTTFGSGQGISDGTLAMDAAGNLYGTLVQGGTGSGVAPLGAYGQLYELTGPGDQTYVPLVNFSDSSGFEPGAGVTLDSAGDIFGETSVGGSGTFGTLYELSADHQTLTTLVNFDGPNGSEPAGGLTADPAGNLYGITESGGPGNYGTAFEIAATVPEPAALSLLTAAVVGSSRRRRRR